jgi:SAM-dependent methyltransferase
MVQKYLLPVYWVLERWIAPGLEWSENVYVRAVKAHVDEQTRWLDLGCGHRLWWSPGQHETARRAALLVGLDPDVVSLRQNTVIHHRVAGLQLPFRDASFTLVTVNMVVEHLEEPLQVLRDIRRVLAPNGVCIFHTPNVRNWQIAVGRRLPQWLKNLLIRWTEGRVAEDVYPTWYRMNTSRTVEDLGERAGLVTERVIMVNCCVPGGILLFGPLVILQLLWIRLTHHPSLREHRNNIIGILRAPGESGANEPKARRNSAGLVTTRPSERERGINLLQTHGYLRSTLRPIWTAMRSVGGPRRSRES